MSIPVFGVIEPGLNYVERPGAYAFLFNLAGELALVKVPIGIFLPGGGLDPGEDDETALRRELLEEIGYDLVSLRLVSRAIQYQGSRFYGKHFKKVGAFFAVEAKPRLGAVSQAEHELVWLPRPQAELALSQEFQRWALKNFRADPI